MNRKVKDPYSRTRDTPLETDGYTLELLNKRSNHDVGFIVNPLFMEILLTGTFICR